MLTSLLRWWKTTLVDTTECVIDYVSEFRTFMCIDYNAMLRESIANLEHSDG